MKDIKPLSVEYWVRYFFDDPRTFIKFYYMGFDKVYPGFKQACYILAAWSEDKKAKVRKHV